MICQFGKFHLIEVVYIADAQAPSTPIQQIIPFINIILGETNCIPGQYSGFQTLAIKKLPVGEVQPPFLGQVAADILTYQQALLYSRDVVQGCKTESDIKNLLGQGPIPIRLGEVQNQELG